MTPAAGLELVNGGLPAIAALATASAAFGLGTRFVDVERPSVEVGAVQSCDGLVGLAVVRHFDKCEAARSAGITISYDIHSRNVAVRLEKRADGGICGIKIQIAYKNILHSVLSVFQLCGLDKADLNSAKLRRDSQKAPQVYHVCGVGVLSNDDRQGAVSN
jgi:hypothetical protein